VWVPGHDVRPPVLVKVPAEIMPRLRHPRASGTLLKSHYSCRY
jgi:hypothetical protein